MKGVYKKMSCVNTNGPDDACNIATIITDQGLYSSR